MAQNFRQTFSCIVKDMTHYFPSHMSKGLRQMQKTLKEVDCVIEIHDARIPLSGRNPKFREAVGLRPHLLVLNKMDQTDPTIKSEVEAALKIGGVQNVLHTNCRGESHFSIRKQVIPTILNMLKGYPRYHRTEVRAHRQFDIDPFETSDFNLLVIGIPNVGKSSFINAMRRTHLKKGKATPVGKKAGVTKSVMERIKVSDSPEMYLYDTPGIMLPNITDLEVGMKLALCGSLPDHRVGEDVIADYMLYSLNKQSKFRYHRVYGLEEPTDNIYQLLSHICKNGNFLLKQKSLSTGNYVQRPDFRRAAQIVLNDFREGKLGRVNLDMDHLESPDLTIDSAPEQYFRQT